MASLVLSAAAHVNLQTIQHYLSREAGAAAAERYATRFADTFERLQQFPASGVAREQLGANTCIALVMPYLVFYDHDPAGDTVVVVRVLQPEADLSKCSIAEPLDRRDDQLGTSQTNFRADGRANRQHARGWGYSGQGLAGRGQDRRRSNLTRKWFAQAGNHAETGSGRGEHAPRLHA